MKKIFPFLLLISISLYSCNSGGSGEAYTLKLRLNKGDVFRENMNITTEMKTGGFETNMSSEAGCVFEVINVDSSGKELKMTYSKYHVSMNMGQFQGVKNKTDSMLKRMNNNAIGRTVILKLSKDNDVIDVSGMDSIMNKPNMDSVEKQMMKTMFSKEQINNLFGMRFKMYPDKPVRVGDSWKSAITLNMAGINMTIDNKFTLSSVKNGLAEIAVNGTIGGKGQISKGNKTAEMSVDGNEKGTITVKMENGYLQSGSYKMNGRVDMEVMGQKIPMTMKTEYTMKGE